MHLSWGVGIVYFLPWDLDFCFYCRLLRFSKREGFLFCGNLRFHVVLWLRPRAISLWGLSSSCYLYLSTYSRSFFSVDHWFDVGFYLTSSCNVAFACNWCCCPLLTKTFEGFVFDSSHFALARSFTKLNLFVAFSLSSECDYLFWVENIWVLMDIFPFNVNYHFRHCW